MHNLIAKRLKKGIAVACIFAMTASSLAGCGSSDTDKVETTETETTSEDSLANAIYKDSTKSTEERVEDLLSRMTTEQKVAQMIMAERNYQNDAGGASPDDVKEYELGAVLSGGGSAPYTGNTAQDWSDMINEYKQAAKDTELGIPILYGVDAVHGNNNVYDTTIFPHQIGMGATGDADLATKCASITALETRAIGANYAFSPVLGIPENERWGRFYECYGEDVDLVTKIGTAYIEGLQGIVGQDDYLSNTTKVICSAKHYIGEGQTTDGVNQGNVNMTDEEWNDILQNELLTPYISAVEAGVQTVMVSYNSVNGVNCHENTELITDVLKGQLGFEGIVISDYNGIDHCKGANFSEQVMNCVNAGVDMIMQPLAWESTYQTILALVKQGKITEERLNDAVTRILRVKFNAGLFEEEINGEEEQKLLSEVGSDEHRQVARQAVRESATLLKNGSVNGKSAIDALNDCKNIAVLGSKGDDIGAQCGGWTISWTGSMGDITDGTTLLEGFEEVATDKTFTHSNNAATITEDTDGVIIVVGETPYSESQGDTDAEGLKLSRLDAGLIEDAAEMVGDDVPIVVVLVTGRPLQISDYLDKIDGLICAWLPGSEGAGLADVIFGDYDFTGKTPVTWPVTSEDIDKKLTDESVVLYPYGTGYTKSEITK